MSEIDHLIVVNAASVVKIVIPNVQKFYRNTRDSKQHLVEVDKNEVYDTTEKPKFLLDSVEVQNHVKRNSCQVQINTRRHGAPKGETTQNKNEILKLRLYRRVNT